jgi:hypothetical protein
MVVNVDVFIFFCLPCDRISKGFSLWFGTEEIEVMIVVEKKEQRDAWFGWKTADDRQ